MKRLLTLLLVALMLCTLACQPTPEDDVVVNKGEGVFEQRIEEAQEREGYQVLAPTQDASVPILEQPPYEHPSRWEEYIEYSNFDVTISADIEVAGDAYPVVGVRTSDFAEKEGEILRILETLIPDAEGMRNGIYTYEDYASRIEILSLGRFDSDLMKYVEYDEEERIDAEKEMAELYEEMKLLPHEEDFVDFSGFVTAVGSQTSYLTSEGKRWYVTITENGFSVSQGKGGVYPEDYYINVSPAQPGQPQPTPYPNIMISQEEAKTYAEDFLKQGAETPWAILKAEPAGMLKYSFNAEETADRTETQGYLVTCARRIGEVSLYTDLSSGGSARLHFDEALYSVPLETETLSLFVDENGVYGMWWNNPIEAEETVANNIELLPFEEIQRIFRQTLKNGLSWSEEVEAYRVDGELIPSRRGYVEKIELSYVIVQEKDKSGYYLMAPAWMFYYMTGIERETNEDGFSIIAINAVDGSRIEL
ncbi:MAG: DUF6034 family protein [Clostridia bacterium]|nr:DUF6034 family protein [Clostridia bacterium]